MQASEILIIDDSPTILNVVEVALSKAGFRVATAPGGAAGLALVRAAESKPALILLDYAMPDMDGAACCLALAADRALAGVPVILMVTKGDDLEEKLAKAPNVVDYITKPFSPEAIAGVFSHVIEKQGHGNGAAADKPADKPAALAEALFGSALTGAAQ